jgi:hypothetical protein
MLDADMCQLSLVGMLVFFVEAAVQQAAFAVLSEASQLAYVNILIFFTQLAMATCNLLQRLERALHVLWKTELICQHSYTAAT